MKYVKFLFIHFSLEKYCLQSELLYIIEKYLISLTVCLYIVEEWKKILYEKLSFV